MSRSRDEARSLSGPESPLSDVAPLDGDLLDIERAREFSRLNSVEIPRLRLFGCLLLSLAVFLHNEFVLRTLTQSQWLALTFGLIGYASLSWLVLWKLYQSPLLSASRTAFLISDVVLWGVVIYATGANQSWLFFLMLVRSADQAHGSFRRALRFGVLSTAVYLLVVVWAAFVAHGDVSWPAEAAKIIFIAGSNIYLSFTARNAEDRRRRTRSAVRLAQNLVGELRHKSEELQRARYRAEESNLAKNEYLANVSHEIRTPLNGIIGMTQLALASEMNPEQRACIETAHSSAESLLRVINDILDFSKIEARKIELQAIHFDLHDRIGEVVKSFGVAAHKKNLELGFHVLPGVPRNVVGDDGRLRQVLVNLLGNAIKFTESGEVFVTVTPRARTKHDVLLEISVRDTGAGVPAEKQDTIFKAWEQADETIARRYGGTGLGLSISSRLVELMGGKIRVEGNEGGGSIFHFTARLWLQRVASVDPRPILPLSQQKQRVLVVDDNRTSANAVTEVLATWDLDPVAVHSTEAALEMMMDPEQAEQPFAIVLIDSHMPGTDGFDLAEKILHQPELPGSMVMMLPSPGDFEGAARCRQLGLSSYITKPFTSAELADAITRALHAPVPVMRESSVFGGAQPLSDAGRLDVLVVEDDPVNRELAAGFLRKRGHNVTLASDGEEGLALLGAMTFDLVLMDVQMPGLSGVETTARIRERESEGQHIPIVALSAHAGKEDRERCQAAGMDGYVTKPLSGQELFTVIEALVPSSGSYRGETVAQQPESLLVQPSELLARVDGNVELARRITRLFIEEAPGMMAELGEAIDAADARAIFSVAHRLKGSVANFPASEPLASAARLEMAGRRNELQDAASAFVVLQEDVHDLVLSLELALDQLNAGEYSARPG